MTDRAPPPVLVSACLLGVRCRYHGGDSLDPDLQVLLAGRLAIPVCPEQLGGLSTPREPAQIRDGAGGDVLAGCARVVTTTGKDVTAEYVKGAEETLRIARAVGATTAILKEKSPSCGCQSIKRGEATIPGRGVTAALLAANGIAVEGCEPTKKAGA